MTLAGGAETLASSASGMLQIAQAVTAADMDTLRDLLREYRALVARILEEARAVGCREVVLDTLPTMGEAQRLYEELGFHEIPSYRPNPVQGARYLGKSLAAG